MAERCYCTGEFESRQKFVYNYTTMYLKCTNIVTPSTEINSCDIKMTKKCLLFYVSRDKLM